ncbi:hypothetical protein EG329_011896 [Mollisiaceae sp. DMI_Dod_QoI]|nr:hypothetical protein EG329_011896 [Helotiales sp. DMI_Dod_QoI]
MALWIVTLYYSITLPSGKLRLATIRDIPRISIVATAGFFYSPTFAWEKRYHHQYPEDTLKSYAKRFADQIRDPGCIVLVTEDFYLPDENTKSGAIIPTTTDQEHLQAGDSVIVAVTSWQLPPESRYFGQFMDQEDLNSSDSPIFDEGLERDKDMSHSRSLHELVAAEEEKHFSHHIIIDRVVVHPAYWRRSHAKTLINWGLALAKTDSTKTGVVANPFGVGLYVSLGFVKITTIGLRDKEEPPNEVGGVILRYGV